MKNIRFAYAALLLLLSLLWWMADPLLPIGYEYFALRTVAINAARAAARERGKVERTSGLSLDDAHQISDSGDRRGRLVPFGAGGRAETSEEASRLMGFAMELPEGYREPLLLKCIKDMSYRQIGELMGLPESTIETRIARGRRMLRELASNPGEVAREAGVRGVR